MYSALISYRAWTVRKICRLGFGAKTFGVINIDRAKLMTSVRAAFELKKQHASNFIYRPTVVGNTQFTIALNSAERRSANKSRFLHGSVVDKRDRIGER